MSEVNFSSKAFTYADNALVQKSASEVLLNLLSIQPGEDVLDIGCGPGHIIKKIAQITKGTVLGIDVSQGMIEQAVGSNKELSNLKYSVMDAESLDLNTKFDVIVCNSCFQWFQKPEQVLMHCFNVLKKGGRIGVQAPATQSYCPNFISAIEKIHMHPHTRKLFKYFKNPWFFCDSKEEYEQLFRNNGFDIIYANFGKNQISFLSNKHIKYINQEPKTVT